MSAARPWYKREPAKFIGGVIGMGPEAIGAYAVILDLIYERDGPIQNDAHWIGGILGCSSRKASSLINILIKRGKLTIVDGFLSNKKASEVIEDRANTHQERVESGAKGGRNNRETTTKQPRNTVENDADISEINELAQADPGHLEKNREDKRREERGSSRATRLPPDWKPTDDDWNFAAGQGLAPPEINRQADKFRDYWIARAGKDGSKLDWAATWRNWIRRACEGGQHRTPAKPSVLRSRLDAIAASAGIGGSG